MGLALYYPLSYEILCLTFDGLYVEFPRDESLQSEILNLLKFGIWKIVCNENLVHCIIMVQQTAVIH